MNDFKYDNIPVSFSGSYSMSVWIFLEDASVLSQGLHINWSSHLQITIIRTTRLEAYCFPQGYYSDSVPNDNIQYKFSSALNVGQVYLVDEQSSESAVWINVICAMSHYNQMFYVNGMDEKTYSPIVLVKEAFCILLIPLDEMFDNSTSALFVFNSLIWSVMAKKLALTCFA
jgi:hypothetical protein